MQLLPSCAACQEVVCDAPHDAVGEDNPEDDAVSEDGGEEDEGEAAAPNHLLGRPNCSGFRRTSGKKIINKLFTQNQDEQ